MYFNGVLMYDRRPVSETVYLDASLTGLVLVSITWCIPYLSPQVSIVTP